MANCNPEKNNKVVDHENQIKDYKKYGREACDEPCAINFVDIEQHDKLHSSQYNSRNLYIVMGKDEEVVIKASDRNNNVEKHAVSKE